MKILYRILLVVIGIALQQSANAAVLRSELQQRTESRIIASLSKQITSYKKPLTSSEKKIIQAKITERARVFASAINILPEQKVNEKLAGWIEDSFVSEVDGLGLRFLNQDATEDALMVYKTDVQSRLQNLSNAKGIVSNDR